jgi:Fe2+ or Zn2+ uptake regulation protein
VVIHKSQLDSPAESSDRDKIAKLTQERDALVEAIQDAIGAGSAEAIIEDLKEALANIDKEESK